MRARRAAKLGLGLFVPHSAVVAARALARRRRGRPALWRARGGPGAAPPRGRFSYDEAESVLTGRGVDLGMIRYGSMPQTTMDCIARVIDELAPRRPLRVLHVGNFVGVSLAALSDIAAEHHPDSRVVSIDPNSRHLGVDDPQGHALALLGHFGLDHVNVLVCGYTLARAVSDGAAACAEVLASLEALGQRFDVAVIDGNHDPDYLRAELTALVRLIDDGGLLMLDDVSEQFVGVRALFEEAHRDPAWPLEQIAYDGERLGVLRKLGAGAA